MWVVEGDGRRGRNEKLGVRQSGGQDRVDSDGIGGGRANVTARTDIGLEAQHSKRVHFRTLSATHHTPALVSSAPSPPLAPPHSTCAKLARTMPVPAAARRAKRVIESESPSESSVVEDAEEDDVEEDELDDDSDDQLGGESPRIHPSIHSLVLASLSTSSSCAVSTPFPSRADINPASSAVPSDNDDGDEDFDAATPEPQVKIKLRVTSAGRGRGRGRGGARGGGAAAVATRAVSTATKRKREPTPEEEEEDEFEDEEGGAISPSKMTARQRARQNKDLQETLIALPGE